MLLDYETLEGLKKTQRIRIKCDHCGSESSKLVYNVISQREKRNEDVCRKCSTTEYNKSRPIEIRKRAGEGCRKLHANKKLEEIVGIEKATIMKRKFSAASSGENNCNFGGKYSRGFADHPLSGSWDERYGIEISNDMKLALSNRNTGEGNPMYGKPAPKRSGNGISGRYKGVYFRSLLELSFMIKLELDEIEYISCESIKKCFSYELNGIRRNYFPDFFIPSTNTFIEVKPSQMLKNNEVNAKANAVIAAGEKFLFVTQQDIIKIKKPELLDLITNGIVTIDKGKESWLNR